MQNASITLPPPARRRSLLKSAHDAVFRRVHETQLIYNCAWEDPRCDRRLLQLLPDSRVVMITSAGCNALDYLLDQPAHIHAVDMNFRQNALLELKLALIRAGNHEVLFEMFGLGATPRHRVIYAELRAHLGPAARKYWDDKISFFDPSSLKQSFYYHGTAGSAAWMMMQAVFGARDSLREKMRCLLDARSLEEQADIYRDIEPHLWGWLARWLARQPALMTLLGVPRPQINLIQEQHPGGLACYVRDKLRHMFTRVPISDNYFWRVYMTGRYEPHCCPNYLTPGSFPTIANNASRVTMHTSSISNFLREHPGEYTHFVLLDHQDWLAAHDPAALRDEWELILQNCAPKARILLRSAGVSVDFIPPDILARLRFHPRLADEQHTLDRVGTYGSTHLAEVIS
jgi:S-adenosylmethionine-diacylglycerol 3-amino-3-carboxypropyl transferase